MTELDKTEEERLRRWMDEIPGPVAAAAAACRAKWAACAKPLGSLGLLETDIEQICALTGRAEVRLKNRVVFVLCADNGVTAQGVTQTDSSVTAAVADQLALGRTAVCRMAAVAKVRVCPVDFGIRNYPGNKGVLPRRMGNGTADITAGPAMPRETAVRAILAGAELVRDAAAAGTTLIATGEMGIGNTTTSSAAASVLLGRRPAEMTGRGAGLSTAGLRRKTAAVETAIRVNKPNPADPVDILSKVGGFDLCGLCGVFLGGAAYRVPVLADGFISTVAALCAVRLCPAASSAVLASHVSTEPAAGAVLEALEKKPLITAEMRLGEGTGAVAAVPLLDMAAAVYEDSYTFEEGGITPYKPQN